MYSMTFTTIFIIFIWTVLYISGYTIKNCEKMNIHPLIKNAHNQPTLKIFHRFRSTLLQIAFQRSPIRKPSTNGEFFNRNPPKHTYTYQIKGLLVHLKKNTHTVRNPLRIINCTGINHPADTCVMAFHISPNGKRTFGPQHTRTRP